jgi:hypothetical protein
VDARQHLRAVRQQCSLPLLLLLGVVHARRLTVSATRAVRDVTVIVIIVVVIIVVIIVVVMIADAAPRAPVPLPHIARVVGVCRGLGNLQRVSQHLQHRIVVLRNDNASVR